jgi:excisionase family DNA binding protein
MTATVRPPHVPETALPVRDVAARYNVSERTVRRWITRDGLSAVKVGHTFWVTVTDLEQFHGQRPNGDTLSAPMTAAPVRLADNGTRGQGDHEAPYLAAIVRELTAENVRLSEELGRLRAELAQRPALPTPRDGEQVSTHVNPPRPRWWARWAWWKRDGTD